MAIKRPTTKPAEIEDEEPKKARKSAPESDEDTEQEEAPTRKGSLKKKPKGGGSFASLFDKTKPGGGFMPVGQHTAYISGFELEGEIAEEGEEQGKLKAKVTYEGHEDEAEGVAGKSLSQWYTLCDDEGQPGGGIGFLKKDLDILGYEDVSLADLESVFEEITNDRPLVEINVKQNGQYTNAYLQGLHEGE